MLWSVQIIRFRRIFVAQRYPLALYARPIRKSHYTSCPSNTHHSGYSTATGIIAAKIYAKYASVIVWNVVLFCHDYFASAFLTTVIKSHFQNRRRRSILLSFVESSYAHSHYLPVKTTTISLLHRNTDQCFHYRRRFSRYCCCYYEPGASSCVQKQVRVIITFVLFFCFEEAFTVDEVVPIYTIRDIFPKVVVFHY